MGPRPGGQRDTEVLLGLPAQPTVASPTPGLGLLVWNLLPGKLGLLALAELASTDLQLAVDPGREFHMQFSVGCLRA